MQYLYSLQNWLEGTQFYQEYLVQMPAPLNSIYFDTIFTAFIVILLGYWTIDYIRAVMDHNRTKKMQREYEKEKFRKRQQEVEEEEQRAKKIKLELEEKRAEDEIHALHHERTARNQREEMNQFMRYVEMSMMVNSTQKMPQSFESFKAQEKQDADKEKREKVQDAFDTIDNSDPVPAAQIAMMDDETKAENARLMEEIKSLREDKARLKKAFASKDKEREDAIAHVRQEMEKTEQEKQAKIDNLSNELEKVKIESKQKMDKMTENQRIFQKKKEQEIEKLKANLPQTQGADRDAKQAEIIRLSDELKRLKKEKANEIADKEKALAQITSQKEQQIADLKNEIINIKNTNAQNIDQLSSALQSAQTAQKKLEQEKQAEIDKLTAEAKKLIENKQAELSAVKQEKQQTEKALSAVKQENAKKQAELSAVKQEKQQTEKALSAVKQENADKQAKIDKLTKQAASKASDTMQADSKPEPVKDVRNTRPMTPDTTGTKQLINTVPSNSEKDSETTNVKRQMQDTSLNDNPAVTSTETISQPDMVAKPIFGATETEVLNADNTFTKLISNLKNTNAKAEALDKQQENADKLADSRKKEMQKTLIVEAEIEDKRDIHEDDTLDAISERKQKVLQQAELEKQRENQPKKTLWSGIFKK